MWFVIYLGSWVLLVVIIGEIFVLVIFYCYFFLCLYWDFNFYLGCLCIGGIVDFCVGYIYVSYWDVIGM